ncbi:MAG: tetratricopeptide repeat protein [Candidatus Gastranaerophilales bacterium]|nr:tetratricopeptide repeat protein [Candidatus Gastranaerophilales bacterium]
MTLAEQYEKEEQYEKAYEEYKTMLDNSKENVHLLQKLGHLASILNKKDEAEEYYKKVVALDNKNIVAYEQLMDICFENDDKFTYYLSRGQMHVLQAQYEHAINDFKKAISHGDDDKRLASTRFILADLYEQAGKYNQAIDEYLKISDTGTATSETYLKLAALYVKTDFLESAIEILQRAKNEGFAGVEEDLAKYYSKANDPQKALELTKDELLKSRCLMELGRNDEAIELLKSIRSKYKNDPRYCSLIAQYYFETDELDTALKKVDEFAQISQNSPLIYQMKALIYEKKGDEFNEHVNWAKYNNLKGDTDIAINEYLIAHQIDENNIEVVATIADMLDLTDKNHSVEFYEKLLELSPNNKRALQKLAEFRDRIGDYVEMTAYLDKLKEIDPRNPYVIENYERANRMVTNPPSVFDNIVKLFKRI